jgi:hypothetical protein
MILSQVLMLASLLIWLPVAGLSVMAFDSGQSVEAWAIVILAWSYPIVPIILIIGAWIAYAKYKNAPAAVLAGLSFAPPILGCLFVTLANAAWFAQNGGLAPFGR